MGGFKVPETEESVGCNLIPMIDIMFLMLLFFMLGADMTQRELADVKLPKADQAVVRRLAGMLRIAEGLDRGHTAIVEKVAIELCPTRLTIRAVPRYAGADLSLECWGAEEQADLMAKVTGIVGHRFSEVLSKAEPTSSGHA